VGGGPAGLAAAIAARRQGFEVAVADRDVPPINKACGEGIMPDGLAAAGSLGIHLDASLGHPFRGIRFCEGATTVDAPFARGSGLGVRRVLLHQVLLEHAAALGVHLIWGAEVSLRGSDEILVDGRTVPTKWIIGADGGQSRVRKWADLEVSTRNSIRFGFRRHYRIAPWSEQMEIHWSACCQLYITPVAANELCVVLISKDPHYRLGAALPQFPGLAARLARAVPVDGERGGASATRRLRSVWRGNVALIGDASGSVDAITGEGLCLLFQQAEALARALAAEDLSQYGKEHRRIARRPAFMSDFMLLLDGHDRLRTRVLKAFAAQPKLFGRMLNAHLGELPPGAFASNTLALGWRMLQV
jgi:2-polyprenyl-6-methoxyphenol hydroxylase-like FAD-dependent oxidoreductase